MTHSCCQRQRKFILVILSRMVAEMVSDNQTRRSQVN